MTAKLFKKRCSLPECDQPFETADSHKLFHSDACRKKSFRFKRKALKSEQEIAAKTGTYGHKHNLVCTVCGELVQLGRPRKKAK